MREKEDMIKDNGDIHQQGKDGLFNKCFGVNLLSMLKKYVIASLLRMSAHKSITGGLNIIGCSIQLLIYNQEFINSVIYLLNYTFHAKMGQIKGRNGMDLTEAEDLKKRWQEYTEEL